MRLKAIALENFRGYKERIVIPLEPDVTGIVGKNDVGKSSLLEALEIFFNNETVKIDAGDLNINAENNLIRIACIFDDLPEKIIVDKDAETTFESEYLLNKDGDLEIIKEYKCLAKVGAPSVYIHAFHPTTDKGNNLHSQKIADLKALGKELGVENAVTDARKSSLWRKEIWASYADLDLDLLDIDVSNLDKDAKSIFSKIEEFMPTFALFRADRESSDGDPEAKNPMQAAVKQAQKELQNEIDILQGKVEAHVLEVANRTLEKIKEMDSTLAKELKPKFKDKPKWTFNFSLDSDDGIPVNKRGSGVRRLILLNFFRAEAEKNKAASSTPRVIYAIEEPETSQHPNYQIMLMKSLLELGQRNECQVLLTTHVPALAGILPCEGVRYVKKDDTKRVVVEFGDENVLEEATRSLGVLPEREIAGAKAIIMIEGPGDITFLHHAADKLKENGNISHTLREKKIVPVFTSGCGNLKHWITRKTADELGIEWAVLMDSDQGATNPNEYIKNQELITSVKAQGKKAHLTKKREPENYIHPDMILSETGKTITYTDKDDAKKIISLATGVKESHVLDRFWPKMTAQQMLEMDQYNDNGTVKNELVEIINDFLSMV